MKFNIKGVSVQTWTRTAVLIIALVSQLLVIIGKKTHSIDIDQATEIVSYVFTALASIWAWWKNNSFTHNAQVADAYIIKRKEDDNVNDQ